MDEAEFLFLEVSLLYLIKRLHYRTIVSCEIHIDRQLTKREIANSTNKLKTYRNDRIET